MHIYYGIIQYMPLIHQCLERFVTLYIKKLQTVAKIAPNVQASITSKLFLRKKSEVSCVQFWIFEN